MSTARLACKYLVTAAQVAAAWHLGPPAARAAAAPVPPAPLAYDMSAYELAPQFRREPRPWTVKEVRREILTRVAAEKRRREMDVYYYRIGYTIAYPLGMSSRPEIADLPMPISTLRYPWMVWYSWANEERWRLFHAAWRHLGDKEAGRLMQQEMAALAQWDRFSEVDGNLGLLTGHTAAALSLALANTNGWNVEYLSRARQAAESLVERDVWPWFNSTWVGKELTPRKIVNIPVIALARAAQLARVINSPRRDALEEKTLEILRTWCQLREGAENHTEGVTYDGYLMETLTEWADGLPDRKPIHEFGRRTFQSLTEAWVALGVPGRVDLHAPLSDVEPEMTFWFTALSLITDWYDFPEGKWLVQRFPVERMRAAGLTAALTRRSLARNNAAPQPAQPRELPYALSLRNGWQPDNLLAAVGLSRNGMGHLQADAGQVVLAWQGRCWITDPGYQQYRPGVEREYTLGPEAHNYPVINGTIQTVKSPKLEALETLPNGVQHARVDLAGTYKGLPKEAAISRDVWLLSRGPQGVVVRDSLQGLPANAQVNYSWTGAHHLAWAFRDGWTRLSDGQRVLWVGTFPGQLEPAALKRHEGTRGPLTLAHTSTLADGQGVRWWVFVCDPKAGWQPPSVGFKDATLEVNAPGFTGRPWVIR